MKPSIDIGARRAHRRGVAFIAIAAAAGPACYSYHPAELAHVQPGEQVRVVLEDAGYRRIAPAAAADAEPRLEGRFQGATADSLALSIWIGQAYRGTPFQTAHQTVQLPRDEVIRIERREISTLRTALTAAGVVGVLAYLIANITSSPEAPIPGGEPPPPPPGPGGEGGMIGGFDLIGALRPLQGR
ncbi:MAG TPA: hypothetical protein VF188_16335 [Longimicrobiales bacterium]